MRRSTLLLARTFFRRFFESELMQQGIPQVQLVIWSVALVVAPGLLLTLRFALTYSRLRLQGDFGGLAQAMLIDRLLLVTVSMAVLGLVGLVIWDGVFPDRRDARHMGMLPLPGRVLILARLGALCALASLFLVGVNSVPTLTYGPLVAAYGGAISTMHGVVAHAVATTSAGAFAFFGTVAIQGALLNLVGPRAAERLSIVLQVLLVVALLQLVFLLPDLRELLQTDLRAVASDPVMRWVPSFWFLGLYDVLGGKPSPGSASLGSMAGIATLVTTVGAFVIFAATHGRLMRLALESQSASTASGRLVLSAVERILAVAGRGALYRAVSEFTMHTIVRSRTHRMLLATYVGTAIAIIVSSITPLLVRQGWSALQQPGIVVLAAPLILLFLSLIGTRLLLAIPAEPKANWIVRLLEPGDRRGAIDAVRNVLLAVIVLPIAVVAGIVALWLWGIWPAMVHTGVCVGMGWLLVEVLLIGFRKIPCTCTYFPGRSHVRTLWPSYLVALLLYSVGTATLELALMESAWRVGIFAAVLLALITLLTAVRARLLAEPFGLRFEEEDPNALFPGFHLSEGLAGVARHRAAKLASMTPPGTPSPSENVP